MPGNRTILTNFSNSESKTRVTPKPGFHIIAPVATVVAVVEKRVLTQKYFLSDASDTVFPYDRRCRSISLKLGRGDLGSITNLTFEREFGAIFKMPADANDILTAALALGGSFLSRGSKLLQK